MGGQNNAYATEEADAGEWKNAAGEGIFWGEMSHSAIWTHSSSDLHKTQPLGIIPYIPET